MTTSPAPPRWSASTDPSPDRPRRRLRLRAPPRRGSTCFAGHPRRPHRVRDRACCPPCSPWASACRSGWCPATAAVDSTVSLVTMMDAIYVIPGLLLAIIVAFVLQGLLLAGTGLRVGGRRRRLRPAVLPRDPQPHAVGQGRTVRRGGPGHGRLAPHDHRALRLLQRRAVGAGHLHAQRRGRRADAGRPRVPRLRRPLPAGRVGTGRLACHLRRRSPASGGPRSGPAWRSCCW